MSGQVSEGFGVFVPSITTEKNLEIVNLWNKFRETFGRISSLSLTNPEKRSSCENGKSE